MPLSNLYIRPLMTWARLYRAMFKRIRPVGSGTSRFTRPAFKPPEPEGNIASVLTRAYALYLGAAAAVILIALSARHLTAQGPHYDELHQAPASFEYLGHHSPIFD